MHEHRDHWLVELLPMMMANQYDDLAAVNVSEVSFPPSRNPKHLQVNGVC